MCSSDLYYLNKNIAERCRKVFIQNIDKDIDKEALKSFFGQYGEITDFNLIYKNKNYGFLYIIFELDEIAISLIEQKFVQFQQHKLEIKKAVPKKEHKKIQYKPQKIEFPILSELYKSPGSYDSYYSTACTPLESRDYRTSTHKDRASFHYDPYISSARHHDTDHCGYPIPVKCQKVDHLQVVCKGRYGRCNTHQGEMSASKGHNDIDFHKNNYRQRIRSEHLAGDSNYRYSNNQLRQTDLSEFYAQEVAPCSKTVANSLYFNGIKEFSLFRRCNSNILQEFQNRHMLTGIIDKKIVLETDNLRNEPTHGFIENKFDFSLIRPKEPLLETSKTCSIDKFTSLNENKKILELDSKQNIIGFLEAEIKKNKVKLESLEDLLKNEMAESDIEISL